MPPAVRPPADPGTALPGREGATPVEMPQGLAVSQLRRLRRIVDAAVTLAEKGGFEGVRLREVAETAQVALGTLYKYFRSKEDILLFVLQEETQRLERAMLERPPRGDTPLDRVDDFFERSTRAFLRRSQLARAVLRSLTAGDEEVAVKVASYQIRMMCLILGALAGGAPPTEEELIRGAVSERDRTVAFTLLHVWFASLVGWAGGLHPAREVARSVREAASLMIEPGRRSASSGEDS